MMEIDLTRWRTLGQVARTASSETHQSKEEELLPTPELSVCIPAYARPGELREAIASVLAQEQIHVEVIVGDDSGDLEAVVHEFDDPRVVYFRNAVRRGMAGNWGAVLDRATAPYLALLMDDDRLLPGFGQRCVMHLRSHPSVDVAFTNHYFQRTGSSPTERSTPLQGGTYEEFLVPLLTTMPVAVSACVMTRRVWDQVRPLPDLLSADVFLFVSAARLGFVFTYLDEPLMVYRIHPGQLTAGERRFRDDGVLVWDHFEFDGDAERLRCHRQGAALISRAGTAAAAGDGAGVRRDLRRARELSSQQPIRVLALTLLSGQPQLLTRATQLWRALNDVRNRLTQWGAGRTNRASVFS